METKAGGCIGIDCFDLRQGLQYLFETRHLPWSGECSSLCAERKITVLPVPCLIGVGTTLLVRQVMLSSGYRQMMYSTKDDQLVLLVECSLCISGTVW